MLGQIRVHVVPGLRAFDKDISLGAKPARVVEAADPKADDLRPGRDADEQRTAALRTKCARHSIAGVARADLELGLAFGDAKPGSRHAHRSHIGAATLFLAVAAMAQQRKQRLPRRLVPHPSAQTAPGPRYCHRQPPYGPSLDIVIHLRVRPILDHDRRLEGAQFPRHPFALHDRDHRR